MINRRMLILSYSIQQVIPNICTKYQNPRQSSSWEIFDTNFPMYYISERWEKAKIEKEGKNESQHLGLLFHNILGHSEGVYKIWRFWLSWGWRNLWQKFWLERKKKGQIKGMVSRRKLSLSYTMQQVIPNICTKFQNPRCSSSWEISDRKKVYTHTHTHCYGKGKNYIPLIFFAYWGYNYLILSDRYHTVVKNVSTKVSWQIIILFFVALSYYFFFYPPLLT